MLKQPKLCFITNVATHYRREICELIDKNTSCDFVFGDKVEKGLKTFDTSSFKNSVEIVHNCLDKKYRLVWQKGVLKYLFRKYDAYIVIDDIRCASNWIFMIAAFLLRKKTFMWSHGYYGKESALKKLIKWPFYHMATRIITYGNFSRELMIKQGYKPEKISVLHNSLAYSKQIAIRSNNLKSDVYHDYFGNDNPNLIFIGRLTPVKRLDMIINAMSILRADGININLTLIGEGDERSRLESLASEKGIQESIWFYGACYDEYKNAELIYNADICVAPGNIGLTAMHVLMFGCPAITHDDFTHQMPEFESIIPGKTGDFFKYGSDASLAETIKKWLLNQNDRDIVRNACFYEIDTRWTPTYQYNAIMKTIINYYKSCGMDMALPLLT